MYFNLRALTLAASLCALPFLASAADYYVGETGRTEKTTIPMDPHAGHNHGDAATSAGATDAPAVFILDPKELYYPEVEAAIKKSGIEKLAVQSEGVKTSLRTFAEVSVSAITGRSKFNGQDPVYTALGMIYQNKLWVRSPIIPVESAKLAEVFGLDPQKHNRVAPTWVMKTPKARTLVMGTLTGDDSFSQGLDEDVQKALKKFAFRLGTFLNLSREFKLVPLPNSDDVWLAPSHLNRPELAGDEELQQRIAALDTKAEPWASVLAVDAAITAAYEEQKPEQVNASVAKLLAQVGGNPDYLDPFRLKLDLFNSAFHPFMKAGWVFFAAFLSFLISMLIARRRGTPGGGTGTAYPDGRAEEYAPGAREYMGTEINPVSALLGQPQLAMSASGADLPAGFTPTLPGGGSAEFTPNKGFRDPIMSAEAETVRLPRLGWGISYGLMILAGLTLVAALVIRFFLGGRMPVSNMYESITFAMGAFSILAIIFEGIYRRGWIGLGASLAGWALMTAANSMPLYSRKVEPLVAVLNSVWLNFHVTSLLISYSCFLLAFVFGILFFMKELTGNRPGMLPRSEAFEYLAYRSVQVGWPLLTLGIFLGGVWANTAWGSFWSWDPKETWALITWLTYTVYLHLRINLGWTGRKSVAAGMVGFVMVLITYFGVSYLPQLASPLHSYAAPIKRS